MASPLIDPRVAWQRYRPSDVEPWDLKKVGPPFRPAGFGAPPAGMENALRDGPGRTIDALLQDRPDRDGDEVWSILSRSITQSNNTLQLPPAWLYRMLYSPNPLREKMT